MKSLYVELHWTVKVLWRPRLEYDKYNVTGKDLKKSKIIQDFWTQKYN